MEQKIVNLLRKAKLSLFTNQLIFFGMCTNKFKWFVEDFSPSMEGFVLFNEKDLSKLETGAIHLNKYYLMQSDYTHNHLVYLLCHELLHILNKHGIRRGDKIHHIWCIACDHVIEKYLKSMSNIIKPYNNQYNIVQKLDNELPNCTTEQAYNWLITNQLFIQIKLISGNGQIPDIIRVEDQHGNLLFEANSNIGGIDNINGEDINPTLVYQTEQFVAEARAILENIKQKGDLSGGLISYLSEILKVEIPWERIVEKSIKTNIIMKPDDRNWRSLNKFFMPHNITLPGYSMIEDTEGTGTLIIGIDTSGSITDKNMKKFSGIIENSMRHFKIIYLLVHDTIVHQRKEFNNDNIHQFYSFLKEEGYKGRGGTSHKNFFDIIEKEFWEKEKDQLSMVISLTDNYSDIQYYYTKYNWIKNNLPFVIIVTKDGTLLNLDKTFGDIEQIQINN